MNKAGKILYSPSYGGGIYSWGYKEVACYFPLIEWIEKYKEENKNEDNKLLQKILKDLGIIEVKKEKINYAGKEFENEYITLDGKKWIKKILNINTDKINDKKSKEIIKILKDMHDENLLDEYIIEVLIQELEIEEIYPGEEIYIHSYDGYETIEYEYCSDAEQVNYNEVILLNKSSSKNV